MKIKMILIFSLMMIFHVGILRAQQANFSIAPPPIAYHDFEPGLQDIKVRGTYFTISGDGIDMSGGGMDWVHRISLSGMFAFDYQLGAYYMEGNAGEAPYEIEMNLWNIPFGGNIEFLVFKNDIINALIFGGVNYTLLTAETGMESSNSIGRVTTATTTVMDLNGQIYGGQAGLQLSLKYGEFSIDPYVYMLRQQGTFTIKMTGYNDTVDIKAYNITSYGLDIAYSGITLSSIMQLTDKSGDNTGLKTYIFSLSGHSRF